MSKKPPTILVTGGAGYIGSHMVRMLCDQGYRPVVIDNLSTGYRSFVPKGVPFITCDVRNRKALDKVFTKYAFDAVVHFAAKLCVPESVEKPEAYYDTNVVGSLRLVEAMCAHDVKRIVFSSTAAVYGNAGNKPVKESMPVCPENPYGRTKHVIEQLVDDVAQSQKLSYVSLRYFNVAGTDATCKSGVRGDHVTALVPSLMRAASGRIKRFVLYGDDYPTKDGSCVRDYIYVNDLCRAHIASLKLILRRNTREIINLGTRTGTSVKAVYDMASEVIGKKIPVRVAKRRAGDPASVVADYAKAEKILGWKPAATLKTMIETAWAWEQAEVNGSGNTQ